MNCFDLSQFFYNKSFDSDYFIGEDIQLKYYTCRSTVCISMIDLFNDFVVTEIQSNKLMQYSLIDDEINERYLL